MAKAVLDDVKRVLYFCANARFAPLGKSCGFVAERASFSRTQRDVPTYLQPLGLSTVNTDHN